ncbi:MAG: ABC transporter permease, partial [Comamonadaceae bacterium]|nr:ABC transporter permease [Comamonadaceae bacterium]
MKTAAEFLRRLRRHPGGLAAGLFIALLVLLALGAGLVPGLDPYAISDESMQPPSLRFALGTDELGRSVLAGVVFGTRVSLLVGFFAALFATVLGTMLGAA